METIRSGVDIYLTDTMDLDPLNIGRNKKLRNILTDITAGRENSKFFAPILKEIEDLNSPYVPRLPNTCTRFRIFCTFCSMSVVHRI